MPTMRLVTFDDVPALSALVSANRDFLAPWQPAAAEEHFTPDGQHALVTRALDGFARGVTVPYVIVDTSNSDRIVGRITVNDIVRGAFESGALSYWVAAADNGRGFASGAIHDMVQLAFHELNLHRLQAATLLHNATSQRVLERNGFVRFGVAAAYLKIAGRWQDHVLYQLVNDGDAS